jgi:biotin carboxylase
MKKILILGAGFLQNFVIMKAKSMGYFTLTVDADKNAIGFANADKYAVISIVDEKACLEYARREKIDSVLTAATDYGVLTASYIAQELGIPGLRYEVAKKIKNKHETRKCLYENHVDDTEQTYLVDEKTDIASLANIISYPVMVKPCDGSGSRGASRVDNAEQFEAACQCAMEGSITHRAEIETFIVGQEYGAESLVVDGEIHVLGIMKKWMTEPPYYAELGHAIPCGLSTEMEDKARECVKKAIIALGVNHGSVNMDLIITDTGKIHIVDIGARMGGNMIGPCIIPYGTGIDYMGNMLKAAVNEPMDWKISEHSAVATKLLAFKGGQVRKVPDFEQIKKEFQVEIYHHLHSGDIVNEYRTNLDGCGYIVARDKTSSIAEKRAKKVLNAIISEIF